MPYTVQDHAKLIAKMRRSGLTVNDMDDETAKSFLYLHQEALTDFARKRKADRARQRDRREPENQHLPPS